MKYFESEKHELDVKMAFWVGLTLGYFAALGMVYLSAMYNWQGGLIKCIMN